MLAGGASGFPTKATAEWFVGSNGLRGVTIERQSVSGRPLAKRKPKSKTNPRVKLPSKFTLMPVRVNKKGEVQIGVNPAKLGSGGRFAKCVKSVEARGGAYDPNAVCAAAGRKKYGAKKMASMARAGKKRATKKRR